MNLAIASGLFTEGFASDYNYIEEFLNKNAMDGLEIILYGDYDVASMPKPMIVGHHLLYWPTWLDFWHQNEAGILSQFESHDNARAYYGFEGRQGMIAYLRKEFEIAKELNVDYMVFHVSNVVFEEVFTFDHQYDDMAVMEASIELINEVFDGEGPQLLFENLWWPGLTFRDVEKTKWFLDQINYENKGFILDIAHLLGTNHHLNSEEEAIDFLHQILDDLGGDTVDEIKGIHLSKTIAGPYLRQDHSQRLSDYRNRESYVAGFGTIYDHIKSIDNHKPFDHPRIMEIIERIKPDYLVYEFMAKTVKDLELMLKTQQSFVIDEA